MRVHARRLTENAARFAIYGRFFAVCLLFACASYAQTPASNVVGTVKSVSGNSVVISRDGGPNTTVTFRDSARIVRTAPRQTDLKTAPPIQISEIQVGDRIAARGQMGDGGLIASFAVVMKQGDIAQRQQAEIDEWGRGVGGIVKDVNASASTVTISNSLAAGGKAILIHLGAGAEIRRYSPDS